MSDDYRAGDRYAEIARQIGAPTHDPNGLIAMIHEVMLQLGTPLTFKDASVDENDFLESLEMLSKDAFDDQCTAANPRYPLVSELKDLLLKSYYGAELYDEKYGKKVETSQSDDRDDGLVQDLELDDLIA